MSSVDVWRPVGTSRRWPCTVWNCCGAICTSDIGSPNSSTMRPVITLPRGSVKSSFSTVWLSRIWSGLGASVGRCWPYERPT